MLQEKGVLAGGTYATTGKTSARSDLSPVFGKSPLASYENSFSVHLLSYSIKTVVLPYFFSRFRRRATIRVGFALVAGR